MEEQSQSSQTIIQANNLNNLRDDNHIENSQAPQTQTLDHPNQAQLSQNLASNASYFQSQQQQYNQQDNSQVIDGVLDANESENIQDQVDDDIDDNQNLLDKSDISPANNRDGRSNNQQDSKVYKHHNGVRDDEEVKMKQRRSPSNSPSRYNKNNTNSSQHTPAAGHTTDHKMRQNSDEDAENRKTEERVFKGDKQVINNSQHLNTSSVNNQNKFSSTGKRLSNKSDNDNRSSDHIEIEEEHKHGAVQNIVNAPYDFNKSKPSQQMIVDDSQPLQSAYKAHLLQQQSPEAPATNVAQNKKNTVSQGGKFTEFLIAEKQRKFVRMPRVYGKRVPMQFKCPNCKTDKEQRTKLKYECTGNQWCACIVFCFFACYPLCCVPFCIKRCYNVKHMCPQCYYQVGESGI